MTGQRARRLTILGFGLCWPGAGLTVLGGTRGSLALMIIGCAAAGVGILMISVARYHTGPWWR